LSFHGVFVGDYKREGKESGINRVRGGKIFEKGGGLFR